MQGFILIFSIVLLTYSCGQSYSTKEAQPITQEEKKYAEPQIANTCDSGDCVNGIGKPNDKYACKIDPDGFCIFTGEPHPLTLKPGTTKIFNLNGEFSFNLD